MYKEDEAEEGCGGGDANEHRDTHDLNVSNYKKDSRRNRSQTRSIFKKKKKKSY